MIKVLYFLSALAIFNLLAVTTLANTVVKKDAIYPTPTPIVVIKKIVNKVVKTQTNVPVQTSAETVQAVQVTQARPTDPPQVTGCIITIDGGKYDVSVFRKQHSGGDVFNCGTDMSAIFWNQHSQPQFNKMQQYRI